ncbi:response regulator transcription factor [Cellulomonas sp. P5_C6]
MRVVVADDSLLTREGIVHLLGEAGVEVVGQAGDAAQLLGLVATLVPDAAIVDMRMPPTHTDEGIVAAEHVLRTHPSVAVLVLSQYVEPTYALRLVEERPEGVGYLLKERVFDVAVLLDALRRLTDGETVIDPGIVSLLLGRRRPADPLDDLSPREREVLALLAEGLSNRGIAERLVVSERTVETHVTRTFAKLGLAEEPAVHRRVLAALTYLRSAR